MFVDLQLKALHQYDCLRANKATSAWGLEARVPFLDKEFLNVAMSIDPEWKMVRPSLVDIYLLGSIILLKENLLMVVAA